MFGFIKWVFIISILGAGWYLGNFLMNMDSDERQKVKREAIEAIDSGDANSLTAPLSQRVKDDLSHRKATIFQGIKEKLKSVVDGMFD